jgi:NADH dehydrogenase [ubiquinone] 1 alpha subcomplex assembly factor 1
MRMWLVYFLKINAMISTLFFMLSFGWSISNENTFAFDFGQSADKCHDWVLVTDNVMGGVTTAQLTYTEDALLLTGDLSLKNFGGFASVKTPFQTFDVSAYQGVEIRFRATGQSFVFTLENSRNWTRPNYKSPVFKSKNGQWETVRLYFKAFKEYQIGEPTGVGLPAEKLSQMVRLGCMTAEKKEGTFSLEIDALAFF